MATPVTSTNKLIWNQAAADLATAQGYTYAMYPDGGTKVALTGVTVTGATSPFACQVPFPTFTPGVHSVTVTASDIAGESPQSTACAFQFVVIPLAPTNLSIG